MNAKRWINLSGNTIILIWIIFIIALTLVSGIKISSFISNFSMNKDNSAAIWNNSAQLGGNDAHTDVLTGMYLNSIPQISIRDSTFDMDFYIWFKWIGNDVDPGKNFEIVNGEINKKELQAEWNSTDEHYEQYHVVASMDKHFDIHLFPLDHQNLTVEIEDSFNGNDELSYIPETSESNMSSQIIVPGYDIKWISPSIRNHNYETDFSSPWTDSNASSYSQIVFGASLSHSGWGLYLKLAQALFISVFVAILTSFLRPDYSPRFNVGIGALFANVASYYFVISIQPPVSYFTIADIVSLVSVFVIFLTLIQSIISYRMYHHELLKDSYKQFDFYSAIAFTLCYIFINLWIIDAAIIG